MAKVVGSNPIIRSSEPAPCGLAAFLGRVAVELLVDQLVRALVVLAADVADRPLVELAQRAHGLEEQRLEPRVLDLVLAADLAGYELRVVHDLDRRGTQLAGELQPEEDGPVLG